MTNKTVWIVSQLSWEYDDNNYWSQDGVFPVHAFDTQEQAEAQAELLDLNDKLQIELSYYGDSLGDLCSNIDDLASRVRYAERQLHLSDWQNLPQEYNFDYLTDYFRTPIAQRRYTDALKLWIAEAFDQLNLYEVRKLHLEKGPPQGRTLEEATEEEKEAGKIFKQKRWNISTLKKEDSDEVLENIDEEKS